MKLSYKNPYVIGGIILIAVVGIWWFNTSKKTPTAAVITAPAEKGTLVESVSGSGSLTAKIQADISSATYGRVTNVFVKNNDVVQADQPLVQVQSLATDEDKAKALASYLSAQDSYNQSRVKLTSLQGTLTSAQQALQDAQKNEKIAATSLASAQLTYNKSTIDAKSTNLSAQQSVYNAGVAQDKASTDNEQAAANLQSEQAQLGLKSSALDAKKTTTDAQSTLQQAQRDEASIALKTQAAQDAYSVAQANLSNQQTSIQAAAANLNASRISYQILTNQAITAPVAGKIVNMNLIPGQIVGSSNSSSSTSSSTTPPTLFSIIDFSSMRATIAISEVDISNVSLGQITTVTFDALPDKTFTGTVSNVNAVGTTTQGVTTYSVEITLDAITPELKPGMTVNASIITNKKQNVVLVPSTAVQTQGGQSVVEIVKNGTTQGVPVTVGDSNDSETEIVSGVNAGDAVVTNPTTTTSSTSNTRGGFSLFGGGGARGGIRPGG
ncbi:MAG TPA: efflux RND transporter periplasmic adaptor subunit [Candidatus Andersenbacteria bacterium]|nr:efflux RND transporter periplasmic adaptor subunit [Candidatus Andersenbacteria bacterium]